MLIDTAPQLAARSAGCHLTACLHSGRALNQSCEQGQITEARVEAERALAKALQKHAAAAGLPEWAGQVIGTTGATWFGGVELSPAINTTTTVPADGQQIEPGLERMVV
jgi:hypothetical protein